LRHS